MASTRIYRTAGSPTLNTKHTISMWFKRAKITYGDCFLMDGYQDASNRFKLAFDSSDRLELYNTHGGSYKYNVRTNRQFRDVSAFYHLVVRIDTTQASASNRVRVYVNGVQEESFHTYTDATQDDANNVVNESGATISIGDYQGGSNAFDGVMTHVHFIDGTSYGPTTFGETDTTSGIWKPKTVPSVTYGNNGFFLKFENSGNMDLDSSGNNHTFTTSGTLTQTPDTPSNVFACWNPEINNAEDGNWSNANLTIQPNGDASFMYAPITIPLAKGKWYSEHMITGGNGHGSIGFAGASKISDVFRNGNEPGNNSNTFAFRCIGGGIKMADANTSYGSAPGTSDAILGIAVDIDNQKFWVSVNGTYVTYGGGVGNPAAGTYGFDWSSLSDDLGWLMICGDSENNGYGNWKSNFGSGYFGTTAVASANADGNGQGAFEYAVPSGYYAICTKNIKEYG